MTNTLAYYDSELITSVKKSFYSTGTWTKTGAFYYINNKNKYK